ncbi:MAG: class I SAM-dependent methyltransferase, partial [Deltaproteobacteria bacterium]|nr:class I SAM-dependent methyltransferase [Deltaproteobacteria bacterium]
GGEQNKKALVVGCEDNGEIAVSLAKRGMFVVVVDDSKERLDRVIARSQEEKVFLKMTFFETDYMKKEFTGGSFDFVSLFSVLGRYNEPFTVIRKCKRELKIGGRILIRMKVKSLLQRLPGFMERIRVKINSLIFGDEAFGAVRDKIAAEFKIERVAVSRFSPPSHFASFFALKELELGKTFKI